VIALGIDLGERRIGIAVSDALGMAHPVTVIEHSSLREDIARVADLAAKRKAGMIVVGLPLSMDGSWGPMTRRARRFANALRRALGIAVEMWDERLTTIEAESRMKGAGRRREQMDKMAAAVMLQSYLDAHRQA